MANDLQELCETVANDIAEVDSTDAIVTSKIKKAIRAEEHAHYWFNELRQPFSTINGTSDYVFAPSTDPAFCFALHPINHILTRISNDGTSWTPLTGPTDYATFKRMEWSVTPQRGRPLMYAITQDKFCLWPMPDTAYTIEVHATVQLAELTTMSSANAWTLEGKDLIATKACELLCREYLRDYERAQAFKAAADEARQDLINSYYRIVSDGTITKAMI